MIKLIFTIQIKLAGTLILSLFFQLLTDKITLRYLNNL